MLLYVGKNFTATVNGSIIKEVNCEKCHGRFYYQLARAASASASAPYYIGQAWAQSRAQKGAARKLATTLQRDSELVPCPYCGHFQEHMLRQLRRRMYGRLRIAGWVLSGVGLLVTGVVALGRWSAHPRRFEDNYDDYIAAAAVCVAVWIVFMLLRRLLLMRVGKKGNEHLLRAALLGAPPPLLPDQHPSAANGQIPLRPAPRLDAATEPKDDQWVVFPLLRIAFPALCCECLSPSTTAYRSLMSTEQNRGIKVPLCNDCARRVRGRGWRGFAMTALMSLSAGGLLAMLPPKMDIAGRATLAVLIAVVASLLAAAFVPSVLSPPFSYKVIDRDRQIVRLSFRNPQYTRLLHELVTTLEGDAEVPPVAQRA